jgi:chromosome segregation ATPase
MKAKATYESVKQAVLNIRKRNENPSVRAVMDETGGSFTTISKHLSKILEDETVADLAPDITPALITALKAEIARHIESATNGLSEGLEKQKTFSLDLIKQLENAESLTKESELKAREVQHKYDELKSQYDTELAAFKARELSLKEWAERAEERTHSAVEQLSSTKEELAFMYGKCEELKNREVERSATIQRLEEKIQDLEAKLESALKPKATTRKIKKT